MDQGPHPPEQQVTLQVRTPEADPEREDGDLMPAEGCDEP